MNDHLCFLKYEKQGTEEEKNWEAEKRGVLGIIMVGHKNQDACVRPCQARRGDRTAQRQGLLSVPASLQSQKPPLASYLEEGWLGSPASPEAYPPQPGVLCLILKSVPAAGMGMENRLPHFSFYPYTPVKSPRGVSPAPVPSPTLPSPPPRPLCPWSLYLHPPPSPTKCSHSGHI